MDRQATIGFILIGLILMVWLYWSTPETPKDNKTNKKDSVKVIDSAKALKADSLAVVKKDSSAKAVKESSSSVQFSADTVPARTITIENDLAIMEFSSKGGTLKKIYFKNYKNWFNDTLPANASLKQKSVQIMDYERGSGLSLEFMDNSGKWIDSRTVNFSVNLNKDSIVLKGKDSLVVEFSSKKDSTGAGFGFRYVIKGDDYGLGFAIKLNNLSKVISRNQYQVSWKNGLNHVEQYIKDELNYSNASVFYGDEHITFSSESGKEEKSSGVVSWIAVKNKYFTSTIVPIGETTQGYELSAKNYTVKPDHIWKVYDASVRFDYKGNSDSVNNFLLYIGPADYNILKGYGNNLTEIVEFGSFFGIKFLVRPIAEYFLLPLFIFLYSFIPNYGIVIIIFSLIIKIILYPLTKNTFQSMKKMQMLQPKIAEIKEKYKDDPTKVQKETMALYSTYGINPAGGCLPMILQMPIFIALFGTFQTAIQLRGEGFIFWIHDLSRPDVLFSLPFTIPIFGVQEISGLALLMGVTTFIQQKMTTKDPSQKALVYIMPIVLTILFMTFPSGLNLYYFMFNLFSILQQQYINKYGKQEELVPIPAEKRKKGFMAKLTEAAEKSAQSQQQQKKKKK
ncbi:MAG: membrane protein insertase YidC [Ignavibacteria bacterium]|nr:membrane protein insertase YidC [Ignavibacteria bacterium]